jgi:hypothetical protein
VVQVLEEDKDQDMLLALAVPELGEEMVEVA